MKFTTTIAALVALTYAGSCAAEDDWDPKCTPVGMEGTFTQRWEKKAVGRRGKQRKVGDDAMEMSDLKGLPKTCKKGVRQFDAYCHQYGIKEDNTKGKEPRYADYTIDGSCDSYTDILEKVHCLAQDCMFDYCMYRRDEFLQECIDEEGEIDLPKANPGWGDVYDYGNMHGDLVSNGGDDFDNATCDDYYREIDTAEFDAAVVAAFGDDQGEGDEQDDDDDDDIY